MKENILCKNHSDKRPAQYFTTYSPQIKKTREFIQAWTEEGF